MASYCTLCKQHEASVLFYLLLILSSYVKCLYYIEFCLCFSLSFCHFISWNSDSYIPGIVAIEITHSLVIDKLLARLTMWVQKQNPHL